MLTQPSYRTQLLDVADLAKVRLREAAKFPSETLGAILRRIAKHGQIRRAILAIDEMLLAIDYVVPCWPDEPECGQSQERQSILTKCLQ
jgi:hypothetical protein